MTLLPALNPDKAHDIADHESDQVIGLTQSVDEAPRLVESLNVFSKLSSERVAPEEEYAAERIANLPLPIGAVMRKSAARKGGTIGQLFCRTLGIV